jgi:hypothetical protein
MTLPGCWYLVTAATMNAEPQKRDLFSSDRPPVSV